MVKGDMCLKIVEQNKHKDVIIRQGQVSIRFYTHRWTTITRPCVRTGTPSSYQYSLISSKLWLCGLGSIKVVIPLCYFQIENKAKKNSHIMAYYVTSTQTPEHKTTNLTQKTPNNKQYF